MQRARTRSFHDHVTGTTPFFRVLNGVIAAFVAVHVVLATYSGYRAIFQIRELVIGVTAGALRPGSAVSVGVMTSGRTEADAELDLVQGALSQVLTTVDVPRNGIASYDPRSQRRSATVVLTSSQLAHFHVGPAVLRATAYGRSQWLRTPAPTVRARTVELAMSAPAGR